MAINSRLTTDYVVFMKSTTDVWSRMPDVNKKANTLYFVVDGPEDDVGRLYLGNTLIADGSGITEMGMEKLSDVSLHNISTGDVLVYNIMSRKWENQSLEAAIGNLIKVFTGATTEADGKSGLVPVPTKDDVNKYLRGDGFWADPTVGVRSDLNSLTQVVNTLVGSDINESVRTIATNIAADAASAAVAQILDDAPEAFDTLKEVATWIADHPQTADFTALQNKVGSLDKILNDHEDEETGETIQGLVSIVNNLSTTSTDLTQRVELLEGQATIFTQDIAQINVTLKDYEGVLSSHTTSIKAIEEKLTWQELYEV